MTDKPTSDRAIAMDSKIEKSISGGNTGSFKPSKPENLSRPQTIKVPPPAPKSRAS